MTGSINGGRVSFPRGHFKWWPIGSRSKWGEEVGYMALHIITALRWRLSAAFGIGIGLGHLHIGGITKQPGRLYGSYTNVIYYNL